jgi:hypothetical protein
MWARRQVRTETTDIGLKVLRVEPAQPGSPPPASINDLASFPAYRAYLECVRRFNFPESESRQNHESRPDGSVRKPHSDASEAIYAGEQRYTNIRLPVLAFFANPRNPAPYADNTPAERAAFEAIQIAEIEAQAKAFAMIGV